MGRWSHVSPARGEATLGEGQQKHRPQVGRLLVGMCGGTIAVLVLSMAASLILHVAEANRNYSVAAVRAQLREHPGLWVGRTVRLRAQLVGCPPVVGDWGSTCTPTTVQPSLADPAGPGARDPLPVTWGGPEPLLWALRGLPLVGRVVPGPQPMQWGVLATYSVRLTVAAAQTLCGAALCYEGVLVDVEG